MNRLSRALLIAAPVLALGLAACGTDHSAHRAAQRSAATAAGSAASASPSVSAAVFNEQDVTFASNMVMHHRQAIQMSDLVTDRSSNQDVINLAAHIQAHQAPEIATMNGWLKSWNMPTPPDMSSMDMSGSMPGMMSLADLKGLAGLKGAAFDQKFLTLMIAHHEGAIAMSRTHLVQGQNPESKTLAEKVIKDQAREIGQIRELLS